MSKKPVWFIAERARALAILVLTERGDLLIRTPDDADAGADVEVEIAKKGHPTKRRFGVLLKGTTSALSEHGAGQLLAAAAKAGEAAKDPFPVCAFVFDVKQNHGFYGWLNEPVCSADGQPGLNAVEQPHVASLDAEALDAIVQRVDQWYEALLAALHGTARSA